MAGQVKYIPTPTFCFVLEIKIINKLQDIYSAHWYFIEFILINLRLFEEMMQNYVASRMGAINAITASTVYDVWLIVVNTSQNKLRHDQLLHS